MTAQARSDIRDIRASTGRRAVVLDDDPTGSQAVHGIELVFTASIDDINSAVEQPGSSCFVLTNSRSLDPEDAQRLTQQLTRDVLARIQGGVDIVTRSDSTLRGHTYLESRAVFDGRLESVGSPPSGILVAPAFFEAGRRTIDDIHRTQVDGAWVPVSETEYARDYTFGFESVDLPSYLAEKSGGRMHSRDVVSVSLDTIRAGRHHIRETLLSAEGRFIVVNGESYDDYDEVALVQNQLQTDGYEFVVRSGPSYVRSLTGIEPRLPLVGAELRTPGRGAVVVGSHVSTTGRQLEVLRARHTLPEFAVDVQTIMDPSSRDGYLDDLTKRILAVAADSDILIYTDRRVVTGRDEQQSLEIARQVSDALVRLVSALAQLGLGWLIAKGGITSHDLAARGLGIRRARLLGQAFTGMVSVVDPISSDAPAHSTRYVIFPGNVGAPDALSDLVARFTSP